MDVGKLHSSQPTKPSLCHPTSGAFICHRGLYAFYSGLSALRPARRSRQSRSAPQNGDSGRYSSQMPIFRPKDAKGDPFDILTKGYPLRPPNRTKSKKHREYFSGSFPLTISAKRNQGVTEVSIPMARAARRAPTHCSEEGNRATFVEPLGRRPPLRQSPRAAIVNQIGPGEPPRVPTAHIKFI